MANSTNSRMLPLEKQAIGESQRVLRWMGFRESQTVFGDLNCQEIGVFLWLNKSVCEIMFFFKRKSVGILDFLYHISISAEIWSFTDFIYLKAIIQEVTYYYFFFDTLLGEDSIWSSVLSLSKDATYPFDSSNFQGRTVSGHWDRSFLLEQSC